MNITPQIEEVKDFCRILRKYMSMEKIRLKELRDDKSMSQAQLAKELGVNHRTISQYETGAREPDIQMIKKICKFFDVSAGYLLNMEE